MGTEKHAQGDVAVAPRRRTATPRRCRVILYNDDYTTQEFVVELLVRVFRKSTSEAVRVMFEVHESGRGVAGVYPHEVAETKVALVHESARAAGFPLRAGLEDE